MGRLEHRAIHFIVRYPKSLIIIAAVIFTMLFVGFESVRAQLFEMQVADYRRSVRVQNANDSISKLVAATEKGGNGPVFCDVKLDNIIGEHNPAYENSEATQTALVLEVRDKAQAIRPSPAFYSLLSFLPHIKTEKKLSDSLKDSAETVNNLTKQDIKSQYCLQLVDVLSEVYFLKTLSTPEGVSAMRVGQVENFQINVKQAQSKLQSLTPPSQFADEQLQIAEILNRIALHLRGDENNFTMFSRNIELQVQNLEIVLQAIHDQSSDLANIPAQLYLHTQILRTE